MKLARPALTLFVTLALARVALAVPPNIIVILADDMGYSDPGCYGGELSTPAIDRLAREGVRLTHFQNGGMCVVSRTSLLTGNWWPRGLPHFAQTPLLPEKLHESGYRTALIGKWHLRGHPLDRGFDHFFGFLDGFADHFAGSKNFQMDRKPFSAFGPDYYSSDAFTDRAVEFIRSPPEKATQARQPFFLYLSYQAPHNPLQAPREDILRHRGHYLDGWQAVRAARFRRQQEMGLVPASATLPDYPKNLPAWSSLTPEQRDLEDLRMSVYAAMIERMDRGINRVLSALTESGQADNTLILFLSDNGTDSFSVMDQPLLKQGKLPGDPASNWQPGTGWAYASVTPWRLYKISQHGGGVTTGAIAWWPGKTGRPGRIEASPIHMVDVLPTMIAAAEPSANSRPPAAVAGESFLPLIQGRPWHREGPLFFQYMDNRAIRTAEWTLAEVDGAGWELFHIATDPFENLNVAAQHPEVVADLGARWLQWWRSESGEPNYTPKSTKTGPNYRPQGDRGSGDLYRPSAMPAALSHRLPVPARTVVMP
jgi:arylsulfatase A-like enzyme